MEKCFTKWVTLQKKTLFSWPSGSYTCRFSRFLSSAEVSTALRPFYFSVHPDLFGQYPAERTVNENSLKQLNSHLELLQQKRPARPTTLTFYLRAKCPTYDSPVKGRTLMFGNDTGVSLDGHIMLNSGEVRHNWLDLIKNVHKQDVALLRIPAFEKAVSRALKDIKVVRRKFQPKVMAKYYENHLIRLMTSLGDYKGRIGYPRVWPDTLENYELVVETEAGPLMLSPTGQFIVPASCPGFLVVNFIDGNMKKAEELLICYQHDKHIERDLCKQCEEIFQLEALQKDDNITPELMIECCSQLLKNVDVLVPILKGAHLWITNYYSVLSDGEMCIPWNWKL